MPGHANRQESSEDEDTGLTPQQKAQVKQVCGVHAFLCRVLTRGILQIREVIPDSSEEDILFGETLLMLLTRI